MWQDVVLAICQLAFVPAMVPTLLGPDKPALSTSVMNAVIVTTIATTMATLGLWFAVSTAALIALIWAVLAVQKFKLDRQVDRLVAEDVAAADVSVERGQVTPPHAG